MAFLRKAARHFQRCWGLGAHYMWVESHCVAVLGCTSKHTWALMRSADFSWRLLCAPGGHTCYSSVNAYAKHPGELGVGLGASARGSGSVWVLRAGSQRLRWGIRLELLGRGQNSCSTS